MSFDWSQFLSLVQDLNRAVFRDSTEEARFRSAISRAYYAALHCARKRLLAEDTRVSSSVHTYVPQAFRDSHDKARKRIGNQLNQLLVSRHKADYDDDFPGLPHERDRVLRQASEVIESLKNLRG